MSVLLLGENKDTKAFPCFTPESDSGCAHAGTAVKTIAIITEGWAVSTPPIEEAVKCGTYLPTSWRVSSGVNESLNASGPTDAAVLTCRGTVRKVGKTRSKH